MQQRNAGEGKVSWKDGQDQRGTSGFPAGVCKVGAKLRMEAPDNGSRHVVQFARSFAGCFLEAMVQVRGIAASAWRRFVPSRYSLG